MTGLGGRAAELATLRRRLDAAESGTGGLVLLAGEPGIGKSRLAAEVADLARERGFRVAWGRCRETDGAPAYRPWTQTLRAVLDPADTGPWRPDLQPMLRPDQPAPAGGDRFRLFEAVADALTGVSAGQPLLLVFDDLHRADAASLRLLRFLVSLIEETRLLVLGSFRDTELPTGHPLAEIIGDVATQSSFQLVTLAGLSVAETARFVTLSAEEAGRPIGVEPAALRERTGGNPFFLTEVLRLGSPGEHVVPATVGAAVAARVVVEGRHRGLAGGWPFSVGFAHIWTLRRGRAVAVRDYSGSGRLLDLLGRRRGGLGPPGTTPVVGGVDLPDSL